MFALLLVVAPSLTVDIATHIIASGSESMIRLAAIPPLAATDRGGRKPGLHILLRIRYASGASHPVTLFLLLS
jgi:hypothetical protein